MRWDRLVADLEAQLEAAEASELAAEVAERTRHERGAVLLTDRLRAATGSPVVLHLGALALHGEVSRVGAGWVLLSTAPGESMLVVTEAVTGVTGLGRGAVADTGQVTRRLELRHALRGIARDRAPVALLLRDGSSVTGTLDVVGADHVDLAEHPVGEPRRRAEVTGVRVVPLAALAAVRSR